MRYLFLAVLLLAGCSPVGQKTEHFIPFRLSRSEQCKKQAALQCMDLGEEDESERAFCEEGAYRECMGVK